MGVNELTAGCSHTPDLMDPFFPSRFETQVYTISAEERPGFDGTTCREGTVTFLMGLEQ